MRGHILIFKKIIRKLKKKKFGETWGLEAGPLPDRYLPLPRNLSNLLFTSPVQVD
jgi:hypothetical protein